MWFTDKGDALRRLSDEVDAAVAEAASEAIGETIRMTTFRGGGATAFGGRPRLAADQRWPVRAPHPDMSTIWREAPIARQEGLKRAAKATRPMAFLGCADLGEQPTAAKRLGLPDQGLLQFFFDPVYGPLLPGRDAGRVLWTRDPPDEPAPPQPGLVVTAAAARGSLKAALAPPNTRAIEGNLALRRALDGDPQAMAAYDLVLSDRETGSWTRIGGTPDPVGTDPRMRTACRDLFGTDAISQSRWNANKVEIVKKALDYVMIAQLELEICLPDNGLEGIAFFLIAKADLAKRSFDKAVTVHEGASAP